MSRYFATVLLLVVAVASVSLATILAIQTALITIGVFVAGILVALSAIMPRVGVWIWMLVISFIPYWTALYVGGITINPAFVSLPIGIGLAISRVRGNRIRGVPTRMHPIDGALVIALGLVLVSQQVFGQQAFLASNVAIALCGAYVVGRVAPMNAPLVFLRVALLVALWGVLEYIFGWHAFTGWFAESGGTGPALQIRGGATRSEASFGHAIAYGATLASALPFTRSLRRWAVPAQILLFGGIAVSLSRGPILAAVVTGALMVYLGLNRKNLGGSIAALGVGAIGASVVLNAIYQNSTQADVALSTETRDLQAVQTVGYLRPFGPAIGTQWDPLSGKYITNGISIVDNTYLRLALDFGWVIAFLLLVPIIYLAGRVMLTRRAGPAALAVTGQIPVLLVTSLIMQWQVLLFFLVGMAITEYASHGDKSGLPLHALREAREDLSDRAPSPLGIARR